METIEHLVLIEEILAEDSWGPRMDQFEEPIGELIEYLTKIQEEYGKECYIKRMDIENADGGSQYVIARKRLENNLERQERIEKENVMNCDKLSSDDLINYLINIDVLWFKIVKSYCRIGYLTIINNKIKIEINSIYNKLNLRWSYYLYINDIEIDLIYYKLEDLFEEIETKYKSQFIKIGKGLELQEKYKLYVKELIDMYNLKHLIRK